MKEKLQNLNKNGPFLTIAIPTFNRPNFLKEALNNDASYCVVSKKFKKNNKFIKVKNTLNFLNQLAQNNRSMSSSKFIAVTGSSGKTTVKTLLGNLLKKYTKTYFSPRSYNNQYGVPLSICNIKPEHDFGVFEVGMNRPNEINKLSKLIKPHIGIITNVSEAHIENFKNIKEIAKAKSEIIDNIRKNGTVILNRDDKFFNYFKKIADKNNLKVKTFGYSKKSDIKFVNLKNNKDYFLLNLYVDNKKFIIKINNGNKNNIMNILCCLAVISELNLSLNKIKNFFKEQSILIGRGKINKIKKFNKNFTLIDESYNANPSSVKSAIENFSKIKKK